MSEKLGSGSRYNLPKPYERCTCFACKSARKECGEQNDVAPFRMHFKVPCVRSNFLMELDNWTLSRQAQDDSKKREDSKASLLDFPPEILDKIFNYAHHTSSIFCLALSCKRMYAFFDTERDRAVEALRWNNGTGPWKQQVFIALNKGWVPKNRVRLCYGCWRLVLYGPSSKMIWMDIVENIGCSQPKISWETNWEVALWLKGTRLEEVRDHRIRCPHCVFYDQPLRLPSKTHVQKMMFGGRLQSFPEADRLKYPRRPRKNKKTIIPQPNQANNVSLELQQCYDEALDNICKHLDMGWGYQPSAVPQGKVDIWGNIAVADHRDDYTW